MRWPQAFGNEKIKLKLPEFIPEPANGSAMLASINLRPHMGFILVVIEHERRA